MLLGALLLPALLRASRSGAALRLPSPVAAALRALGLGFVTGVAAASALVLSLRI